MRKEIIKSPRVVKKAGVKSGISSRRVAASKKNLTVVPVFSTVDDEEYFFEVEDF